MCPNNITSYLTKYYGNNFATTRITFARMERMGGTTEDAKGIAAPRCPDNDREVNVFIKKMIKY